MSAKTSKTFHVAHLSHMMLQRRQPPLQAAPGAGRHLQGSCRGEALRDDALVAHSCAERSCRVGLMTPLTCKHCAQTFCAEHSPPDQHGCGPERMLDKRALVCELCNALVIEHDVLQGVGERSAERARYDELLRDSRLVHDEILAVVREKLDIGYELRANPFSFWSTMDSIDEGDVVPAHLRERLTNLKQQKMSHLLALHMITCAGSCSKKTSSSGAALAPASHKQSKCSAKKCKNKGTSAFLQHCRKCNKSFCISHRLPEVHSCCA